jgi:hypothetical protein
MKMADLKKFDAKAVFLIAGILSPLLILIWGWLSYEYINGILQRPASTNPNLRQIWMDVTSNDLFILLPFSFFIFSLCIPPFFFFSKKYKKASFATLFSFTILIMFLIKVADAFVNDT